MIIVRSLLGPSSCVRLARHQPVVGRPTARVMVEAGVHRQCDVVNRSPMGLSVASYLGSHFALGRAQFYRRGDLSGPILHRQRHFAAESASGFAQIGIIEIGEQR